MKYSEFVKMNYHKAQGATPQEKMKSLGAMWRASKGASSVAQKASNATMKTEKGKGKKTMKMMKNGDGTIGDILGTLAPIIGSAFGLPEVGIPAGMLARQLPF